MRRSHREFISLATALFALLFIFPSVSSGQSRCSCEYKDWIADCEAKLVKSGNKVKVFSNTQQCSRVDWYAGASPQVTIVTDGAEVVDYLGSTQTPSLVVQSCKVCKDTNNPNAERTPNAPQASGSNDNQPNLPSVSGTWEGKTTSAFGSDSSRFELNAAGNGISGTWQNANGLSSPVTGTIDGQNVQISLSSLGHTQFTFKWDGGDAMVGKWKEGMFRGSVELRRVQ